jgi:hypothetical protein
MLLDELDEVLLLEEEDELLLDELEEEEEDEEEDELLLEELEDEEDDEEELLEEEDEEEDELLLDVVLEDVVLDVVTPNSSVIVLTSAVRFTLALMNSKPILQYRSVPAKS